MPAGVDAAFARQFLGARGGDGSVSISGADSLVSTASGSAPAILTSPSVKTA